MSSQTKVSPSIRDHVPAGFYVDDRTWDVGLVQDLQAVAATLQDTVPNDVLEIVKAQPAPAPRRQSHGRNRNMRILLVEDNPGDVRLIREALDETQLPIQLSVAENGQDALHFLRRRGKFAAAARPDLILLDLNLPLKDGREVLDEIKQDVDLRRIPVVVLTTSQAEHDIFKAYDLHANCYIRKRLDLEHFMMVIQLLESFWFHIVQLSAE
jgi:two-component system, chemotaxis family, response regulator Rcp1